MRHRFKAFFATLWKHQWAVVGILAVAAFVLGLVGLHRHTDGSKWSWPAAIYFSLRLFGFNYDLSAQEPDLNPYAQGNWQLWAASFLAPLSTALAVVKAVAQSVASRIDLWRVSCWEKHAVVCGAGERGHHLALSLRRENKKVVVVDEKEDLDSLKQLRDEGVIAIRGNVTDPATLAAARVDSAAIVVALTPSVEANLEVVLAASQRKKSLSAQAFAYAPRAFATMFESQKPFWRDHGAADAPSVECGFFDHNATAARVLVHNHAPDLGPTLFREQRGAHILVAGDGEVISELLGVLIAQCQFTGPHLPHITLLTVDEDAIARGFPIHHPQRSLVVDLHTELMSMSRMLRVSIDSLATGVESRPFDMAFVACREDGDTLSVATNLAQQGAVVRSVIAGLAPSTALERKFEQYFGNAQPLEGVVVYNLLTLGCEARDVVRQELDRKARLIHEDYYEKQILKGKKHGERLAMYHWPSLRGDIRESNRSQADHDAIKRGILRLSRTEETIESIAEAEHRRWMAERMVSGWRFAATSCETKRLHSNMVPYAELTEDIRDWDRNAVRNVASGSCE
jgi:voltage-gated potassium channel Kch